MSNIYCMFAFKYNDMACGTTTAVAVITEAEFNSLGFFKVLEISTTTTYVKEQYKLMYESVTMKVTVTYTAGTSIVDYILVGIYSNFSSLETALRANGVIV